MMTRNNKASVLSRGFILMVVSIPAHFSAHRTYNSSLLGTLLRKQKPLILTQPSRRYQT
jgi:hypothetical protein